MVKVLLTGGSGFIAAHILDQLLERGFDVVTTVRSAEKGERLVAAHPNTPKEKFSYVIVKDVAEDGAFDEAVKSDPPFDYVLHTASPFHFNIQDPVKDFLDPAIKGTTGILKAIKAHAPTVKRVVITSSFAAIINTARHEKVYSEKNWNPVTWEEGLNPAQTYRASKTFAEKAAWDFVEKEKPNFDIATINPPLVLGPVVHYLSSLDAINTSNARIARIVQGLEKEAIPPTTTFLWVDVRDVALAHIRAIEVPEAGAQRFFVTAGTYANKDIVDIIRDAYPELDDRLPPKSAPRDLPKDVYGYDNTKSIQTLGVKYHGLKESVVDTVKTLLEHAAKFSPTANLLRRSRLFALPQALSPPTEALKSRTTSESETATLPHPIRASIATPPSSLARGDWGLKRPLPAKSTSQKSSRPIVRVVELDTFEHVTDFESAADHTVTLEKFQELHMPMSLPSKVNYAQSNVPRHQSPFEANVDNTESSEILNEIGAKQFRQTGPWLGNLSEMEFNVYLKKIKSGKPELLRKLRERLVVTRTAERKKEAQDNGEDLENLAPVQVTEEDFRNYLRTIRADPLAMGPVIFELLDLPSPPAVPSDSIGHKYFSAPITKLSSPEYAAGLSYSRTHALAYNHPTHGPQIFQRPVEARILRPKGKFKNKVSKALAGVGGIAVEDLNAMTFAEQGAPPGLAAFDATIPGGGKYYVTPIRAAVDSDGRIQLSSYRAAANSKAAYGIKDHKRPLRGARGNLPEFVRDNQRTVPRLDRARLSPQTAHSEQPAQKTEDVARNLMKTLTAL
ncbi:NAD(P)-binding protein [Aspergillus cavernicola]|uniref:NAD(P)-binding protein n=1 Tax=Aspergillus cavernicola TaxID=176166 RepID=A0ABR4J3C7_9EURO